MQTLVIDNFDSFTYNLVDQVRRVQGKNPLVVRNNRLDQVDMNQVERIIVSPGPGIPEEAGGLLEFLEQHLRQLPVLGICLGHQGIAELMGAKLELMENPIHGKPAPIRVQRQCKLFQKVPEVIEVGRYHSWRIDKSTVPSEMMITSLSEDGEIMSFEHRQLPIFGLQFHPESIMTPLGDHIVQSFIEFQHD